MGGGEPGICIPVVGHWQQGSRTDTKEGFRVPTCFGPGCRWAKGTHLKLVYTVHTIFT